MKKWLPISIATLVAINLVIFLRQSGQALPTDGAPKLLPNSVDAQALKPNSIASRIRSYSDGPFIVTGEPTRQRVPSSDAQAHASSVPTKTIHQTQHTQPVRAQRRSAQRRSVQHAQQPARNSAPQQQPSARPMSRAEEAVFYQTAMQLAHGNLPYEQIQHLGPAEQELAHQVLAQTAEPQAYGPQQQQARADWPPARRRPTHETGWNGLGPIPAAPRHQQPRRLPQPPRQHQQASYRQQINHRQMVPQQNRFPVRLVQNDADVENLLIGNPEVPNPPGFEPPTALPNQGTPQNLTNQTPSNPTTSAGPNQAVQSTPTASEPFQRGVRFPDQSPGEYAVGPKSSAAESGGQTLPGNSQVPEQLPKPVDNQASKQNQSATNAAETKPPISENQGPAGNGRPDPFEPAPDENLLRPNQASQAQGQPAQGQPTDTLQTGPQTGSQQSTQPTAPHSTQQPNKTPAKTPPAATSDDPHYDVFANSQFPSARECGACHKQIFDEWSVSNHAYASISPMFHRFEQTINTLAKGTIGYFCMRCHASVATTLNHPREKSIWESIPSAHEGVTCITCHRVREHYGKVNGDRRIEPGDIFEPVSGSGYGEKLREVIAKKEHYKVQTEHGAKGPGQKIHTKVIHFEQISESDFCVSCHQVAVYPGIALEVVWAQYRASPACKEGISCQDCHMGSVPGKPYGYDTAPVAVVGGKEVDPGRKHSNHMFVGPGYSIAHPGIFPFRNKKVEDEDWTPQEWNQFDYRAGWGTDEYEKAVDKGHIEPYFPEVWENADDRADARELIEKNLEKLALKKSLRHELMEKSSKVHGPIFKRQPRVGKKLQFKYIVENLSNGHNMPSGSLGAQPQLWVNVALTGPTGQHLWESGYVDCNGDIADLHSMEVAKGRIRRDQQLVNFQTKFLIQHVKGPDREMYLPVPTDQDQLPFIRPAGLPISVLNHPPTIRMEAHSVPPLGKKEAKYHVPAKLIQQPGVYQLHVRLRSRAEPIYFMRFCRATPEMERRMNERMLSYHEHSSSFVVR